MTAAALLLAFVTLERLAELWLAHRNTKALLASGAVEIASEHYVLIVLLHSFWLAGLWLLGWHNSVGKIWLAIFLLLQALRVWVLMTLGRCWTTRIIVRPDLALVTTGPYRLMSHPNYCVVVGEIVVLPLCLGLPWYALAFSIANAAVLTVRIRAENAALSGLRNVGNR